MLQRERKEEKMRYVQFDKEIKNLSPIKSLDHKRDYVIITQVELFNILADASTNGGLSAKQCEVLTDHILSELK